VLKILDKRFISDFSIPLADKDYCSFRMFYCPAQHLYLGFASW
jgi:hypothetical protein